jgi:hypothetical protein
MRGRCARLAAPGVLSAMLVAAAGCRYQPYLVPAPGVPRPTPAGKTGIAEVSGVRLEADGDAWQGRPINLEDAITPVLVKIQNQSGKPLRTRYKEFTLTGSSGFTSAALPPFKITGSVPSAPVAAVTPAFGCDGFLLAPYYGPFYPGFGVWGGPFDYDYPFYATYYAQWPVSLPTKDMIANGIPEGVLSSGGHLNGFLYFPKVPKSVKNVTLEVPLVDANTRATFATIKMPFAVVTHHRH